MSLEFIFFEKSIPFNKCPYVLIRITLLPISGMSETTISISFPSNIMHKNASIWEGEFVASFGANRTPIPSVAS